MKKSEKTGRIAAAVAIPLLTGGAGGAALPGELWAVCPACKAAAGAAGMGIPLGMDNSLYPYGSCLLSGLELGCFRAQKEAGARPVRRPACPDVFLAAAVFCSGALYLGFPAAGAALAAGLSVPLCFFLHLRNRRQAHVALPAVAQLCGLFESWGGTAELKIFFQKNTTSFLSNFGHNPSRALPGGKSRLFFILGTAACLNIGRFWTNFLHFAPKYPLQTFLKCSSCIFIGFVLKCQHNTGDPIAAVAAGSDLSVSLTENAFH